MDKQYSYVLREHYKTLKTNLRSRCILILNMSRHDLENTVGIELSNLAKTWHIQ